MPEISQLASSSAAQIAAGYVPITDTLSGIANASKFPALALPNISPYKLWVTIPKDASNYGAQVNQAILDAVSSHASEVILTPGDMTAEVPINNPGRVNVRGGGVHEPDSPNYSGGVLVRAPFNSTTGCLAAIGTNPNPGSSTGFVFYPRFENIACTGATPTSRAVAAGGPPKLIKCVNTYGLEIEACSGHNDFHQALYLENTWEFHVERLRANACGFSDPHASPSDATVVAYTNRNALAFETLIGRSLGVPAIEIRSPNTNGQDTCNNGRLRNCHIEGNEQNGMGLLIHGGNANNITCDGWHHETADGNVPLFLVVGITGFRLINSFLLGGGTGTSQASFGGVTIGDAWSAYTNPGFVVLNGAPGAVVDVNITCVAGGAPLQAFARHVGTENPRTHLMIVTGRDRLTPSGAASLIFDNCGPVSAARNQAYAWSAGTAFAAGAVEKTFVNGSTNVV